MQDTGAQVPATLDSDDARLEHLGYRPQLNRVLGLFANFSVAFTYLSPIVGIFSLFTLGLGTGGPGYIWPDLDPGRRACSWCARFGELASHYPIAGALFRYSRYIVDRRFGWFVGWFYGVALLVTVASVDTGVVGYVDRAHARSWSTGTSTPTASLTILVVILVLLALQSTLNIIRARVIGRVARFGVYVEIRHPRHRGRPRHPRLPPRLGFLSPPRTPAPAADALGLDFGGRCIGGAPGRGARAGLYLLRLRVDWGHLRGDPQRQPAGAAGHAAGADLGRDRLVRADRRAAAGHAVQGRLGHRRGDHRRDTLYPQPAAARHAGRAAGPDHLRLLLLRLRGAGRGRRARVLLRPGRRAARVHVDLCGQREVQTPANALFGGALVTVVFIGLEFASPSHDVKIWFITYPANTNVLVSLVSFGVSGIYLSFLLTVIGSMIARARGWVPAGKFTLGRWAWPVSVVAAVYLGLMLVNVVLPSGPPPSEPRWDDGATCGVARHHDAQASRRSCQGKGTLRASP